MPYVLPYQPTTQDKLRDALIAALPQIAMAVATKGVSLIGNIPNPTYGQTGSPGTVFGQGGQNSLAPQNPQQVMGGFRPQTPGSPYANQPKLNQQQFQTLQNLQQYQANAAKAPLELQKLQSDVQNQQALSRYYNKLGGGGATLTPEVQAYLAKKALEGDAEAEQVLRTHGVL